MTTAAMRKKLTDYMQTATDKKVRALYTIVEDEIETAAYELDDETFEELKRRSKSFLDGSAKMYTWEETQKAAMDRINEIRRRP
jgi:hypothetical protein